MVEILEICAKHKICAPVFQLQKVCLLQWMCWQRRSTCGPIDLNQICKVTGSFYSSVDNSSHCCLVSNHCSYLSPQACRNSLQLPISLTRMWMVALMKEGSCFHIQVLSVDGMRRGHHHQFFSILRASKMLQGRTAVPHLRSIYD